MKDFYKYPRTKHLEGSSFQSGDDDTKSIDFSQIKGKHIVIEEKVDGANCGISFNGTKLRLQSRGHILNGSPRERHFSILKAWGTSYQDALFEVLGSRYIMYGEWMQGKHTQFYDALPHYFLEFDVFDKTSNEFLSTLKRKELLSKLKIPSVPVLWSGKAVSYEHIISFVGKSVFRTDEWEDNLRLAAKKIDYDFEKTKKETDMSGLSEGLYIKIEDESRVIERVKFVRQGFKQSIIDSESHWMERPLIENLLVPEIDIWKMQSSVS